MRKLRIKYLAAGVGLACWTTVASAGLFSASGPVIAIVADELFVGTATGHIDGTGTVVIRSQEHSDLKCAGEFASNGMLGGSPAKVAALIEARILPHFDFARMTQIAVARNWRVATPEQQQALTAEFKTLLVRTYSTALSNYRDQAIEFKRLRAGSGETNIMVNSVVKQSGTEPLTIDYAMEHTPAGWKVYDIRVAGVSLIATYRDTFAGKVREAGLDGLIKSLADKNRQADIPSRSRQT